LCGEQILQAFFHCLLVPDTRCQTGAGGPRFKRICYARDQFRNALTRFTGNRVEPRTNQIGLGNQDKVISLWCHFWLFAILNQENPEIRHIRARLRALNSD
jgi:hypothetical protein